MAHYKKQRSKVDTNQNEIVVGLLKIPGISVERNHDDILVGYQDKTYWYEIKSESPYKKDGTIKKKALKDSQVELWSTWKGHYNIVWSLEQILKELNIYMGIKNASNNN